MENGKFCYARLFSNNLVTDRIFLNARIIGVLSNYDYRYEH